MHSSWIRSSFVVTRGTWRLLDRSLWCKEDGGHSGHTLLLVKDEVGS
jgi:hypothetical protein